MEYLYLDRHSEHLASSRADPIDVHHLLYTYYVYELSIAIAVAISAHSERNGDWGQDDDDGNSIARLLIVGRLLL
jgi:hypothetical protein